MDIYAASRASVQACDMAFPSTEMGMAMKRELKKHKPPISLGQNWLTGCIVPWKYWMNFFSTGRRITCAHRSWITYAHRGGWGGWDGEDGNVYVQI